MPGAADGDLPAIPAIRKPSVQGRRYPRRAQQLKHHRKGISLRGADEPVPLVAQPEEMKALQPATAQPEAPLPHPQTRRAGSLHLTDASKRQLAQAAMGLFCLAREALGVSSTVSLTLSVDDTVLWAAKGAGQATPAGSTPDLAPHPPPHPVPPAPPPRTAAAGARLPSLPPSARPDATDLPAPDPLPTPPMEPLTRSDGGSGRTAKAPNPLPPPLPPLGDTAGSAPDTPPMEGLGASAAEAKANASKSYKRLVAHFKHEIDELKDALEKLEAENEDLKDGGAKFAVLSRENHELQADIEACRSSIKELVSLVALCNEKIQVLEAEIAQERERASLPQKVAWDPLRDVFAEFVLANNRTDSSILKEVVSRVTTMKTLQLELAKKNHELHQRVAELVEEAQVKELQVCSFREAANEMRTKMDQQTAARAKALPRPAAESALFSSKWR